MTGVQTCALPIYSGRHPEGYSCPTHGDAPGRLNVLLEIRQDLVQDEVGIGAWIERLAAVVAALLETEIGAVANG